MKVAPVYERNCLFFYFTGIFLELSLTFCHQLLFISDPGLSSHSFTLCPADGVCVCAVFQARQVLEREFNNLLALGTDRRLEEVTSQAAALIK